MVKRLCCTSSYGEPIMEEDELGDYVDYEDYETLMALCLEQHPIATAPKDRRILLVVGNMVGSGCWRAPRPHDVTGYDFYVDGGDMPSRATHWMNLPKGRTGNRFATIE
mgnify:CR=1 FL=1